MPSTRKAKKPKRVPLGARIEKPLLDQLQTLADTNDRSLSAELRQAVRAYLEANGD